MSKHWTRTPETIDRKETADPWHVTASDTVAETLHASDLAPKPKPRHPKAYYTEQPK